MGQTDVLGLSASIDIDDIRKSITDIVSDLQRVGAVTEATSAKLQRELEKIGSSADKDLSAKLTAAMGVLQRVMKDANDKAQQMGDKLGGTAKQLADGVKVNTNFVEAHMKYVEKTQRTLQKALQEGDKDLAEWALKELKDAEQRIGEAVASVHSSLETIERIANSPIPKPAEGRDNVRTQLRQTTQELAALTIKYREMSDAEQRSAQGVELKQHIEELIKQAGTLRDAMDDANTSIKAAASDTAAFDALSQGLNVVTSTAGAAEGVVSMLGVSEEDLMEVQTKLQASLAISNALSTIQTNLQKESALMLGVRAIQEKAVTAGIALRTAAEGKGIIATKAATIAQAAFNTVAKANPYVLLAMAIVTVVGALAAFAIGSKKATEAEKEQAEAAEKLKQKQEEMSNALGKAAGNVEAKYRSLQQQWGRLKTESEKNKWIKDNANAFKELGLKVGDVSDAEQVLVNLAPQVIAALKAVAEAEAYSDLYKQAIVKRATEWEHRVKGTATGDTYKPVTKGEKIQSSVSTPQEWIDAGLTYGTDYSTSIIQNSLLQAYTLTKAGVDKINKYRNDQAVALRNKLEAGYNEEVNFYADKWEQAERAAAEAKKKIPQSLFDTGGSGNGNGSSTTGVQLKSARELNDQLLALRKERIDNELALEKEGTTRYLDLMRERIALQAEADRRAVQKASDEAVADLDASYKGGKSGLNEQQYTERRAQLQQQAADAIVAINAKQNADIAAIEQERQRAELASMLDYLKQYGSIQQQKYAIAKEYDEKIAKEQDEYRRKALEAEKQSRLAQMNAQNLAQNINWGQMFSGVGNVLQGIAQETLKKVSDYMKTDEYKKLSPTDKKTYQDLRTQLVDAGGISASNPFSGQVWKEIGDAAQRYRNSVLNLNKANERAEQIRKQLTQAEQEAASTPTDKGLQDNVAQLRKQLDEAGTAVNDAQTEYVESQEDLRTKTESVAKGFNNFNTILGQITSGSLSGFATAVGNIIKKISGSNDEVATNFGELFGEAGKQIGGLVGAILQIIDILGTEPAKFIDDLLAKVADVLEAVLSQLPEIIASAIKGVGNIVGSIFTGLAEGVASLFGGGADNSAYENALDKWGHILETWEENLKYEKQLMEKAYGGDLLNLQKETMQGLKNAQTAAAEIYRGWAGSGAGWFSHSNGYNVNEDTDWGALVANNPDIARQVGVQSNNFWGRTFYDGGSVENLFNLDWRELEKLKYSNTKFWQSLHGEAQKYLEQFIEAGKAMDEVQKATWEKLTTTTSDNVFDGFLNSLYELANKSEDVFKDIADNWQEMVNKMVINNLIGKNFQSQIESWYEKLANLNERRNKGEITNEQYQRELENLRQEYEGYVKKAQQKIEDYRNAGIISVVGGESQYEQSASSKAWQTMSQDSADELNGRFTVLYESNLQILNSCLERNELLATVQLDTSAIRQYTQMMQGNITELVDIQLSSLTHLENIDVHTSVLPEMAETIASMNKKLKNL